MQEKGNWKPYNVRFILSNIKKVFDNDNMYLLSKASYKFLYMMSGFIAHYNLYGFQDYYSDVSDLANELDNEYYLSDADRDETDEDFNKWYGERYNRSKAEIKRGLVKLARSYKAKKVDKFLDVPEHWVE